MVALAIGLGTAAVTQVAGLSLALGAFLAGLIISQSDYAHETLARLLPLRDVFVALFFVTIGVLIDPRVVVSNHALLATMIGLIMIGKFVIWTAVVRLFGYPTATACLVGVGLTQIGEFSFVLVQAARGLGHVGHDVYNAVLAASLITILLNAALVRYAPLALTRLRMMKDGQESYGPARLLHGHVVICGYGRIGGSLGEAFDAFAIRYTVIERDPDIVDAVRARAIPCFFGDAAHHELLTKAGVAHAALVVLAIPDAESRKLAMRRVREINIAVPVVARAHTGHEAEDLLAAGATEVIQPEIEGATTLIRHTLVRLMQPKEEVLDYLTKFRAGRTE
jgi:CPA2 family monovalent cation:H+ antiporter-2